MRTVLALLAVVLTATAVLPAAAAAAPDIRVTLDGKYAINGSTEFEPTVGNLDDRTDCKRREGECLEDLRMRISLAGEVVKRKHFEGGAPFRCNDERRASGLCAPDWADGTFAVDYTQAYYEWNCERAGRTTYTMTFTEKDRPAATTTGVFRVPRCEPHLVGIRHAMRHNVTRESDAHVRSVECEPRGRVRGGLSARWRCTLVKGGARRRCTETWVTDFVSQGDTHRVLRDKRLSHACVRR